jgi:RNA polymerase-binding transcription factor DksA
VRDLIQKIERALQRIDAGTYGICERCGNPIEKARLKALPYVDLCIKDAQASSRR